MMAEGKDTAKPDGKHTAEKQEQSADALEARRLALGKKLKSKGVLPPLEQEVKLQESASTGFAQAFKLSSEFFAAILVGAVLGIGLDQLAGTTPWGLIVFLFLGFAAGLLNILRSAGMVAPSRLGAKNAGPDRQGDGRSKGLGHKPDE